MSDPETVLLIPDGVAGSTEARSETRELVQRVLWDEPVAKVRLPNGTELGIYAKSERQLNRVDLALYEWTAEAVAWESIARIEPPKGRWARRRWKRRMERAAREAELAKAEFFRRIFEDLYLPARHGEFTAQDFACLDIPTQESIVREYRRANDATGLMDELFPGSKKKPMSESSTLP